MESDNQTVGVERSPAGIDTLDRDQRERAVAEIRRITKGDSHEDQKKLENVLERVWNDEIVSAGMERENAREQYREEAADGE